ncbi:MAG: sialate O-acetylesterase, partial [Halioglobus sp.]|nr:sialate O-acetylesterase [Halioglobus sp.]
MDRRRTALITDEETSFKKWLLRLLVAVLWIASIDFFYGTGALVGQFNLGMAEGSMARAARVWMVLSGDFVPCAGAPPLTCGFRDTTARVEVDCADYQGQGAAVLMTFGQSNSANAGRDRYFPVGPVANFNIHDGRCYRAEDPLLGPDGPGGSVWGVLADKLIAAGHYDRVLLVPFGIGGSALAEWQNGAYLHPILQRATRAVRDADIVPTHVLWHQGEADADDATPEAEYFAMFESLVALLREYGIAAPVYPAV